VADACGGLSHFLVLASGGPSDRPVITLLPIGTLGFAVNWSPYHRYDVRLQYISPYQTIASDWHYLGRIA